jgi:hypothetical protein
MNFHVDYSENAEQRILNYESKEYSFDTQPSEREINFDLVLNKLNLSVVDGGKVVQVWGFCPYGEWKKSNHDVPHHSQGNLKITNDFEPGFSYKINKDTSWPIYANRQTGWVCIGNPDKHGNAVEFINNCVAVIGENGELLSLWLRPRNFPQM